MTNLCLSNVSSLFAMSDVNPNLNEKISLEWFTLVPMIIPEDKHLPESKQLS